MVQSGLGTRAYKAGIHIVFMGFSFLCIVPIIAIISISLTGSDNIAKFGYRLIPVAFDLEAYRYIFASPGQIANSYVVTIIITLAGTLLSLLVNSFVAYPLSRKDFKYRGIITFFIFFPMFFGGGLVPYYILVSRYLGWKDSLLALIVPGAASAWNILLLRTYFSKIPVSLFESALLDGANELSIYCRIVLPLSKPSLATVGFLTSLGFWNDWFGALLFIEDNRLLPLQYMLQRIMANIQFLTTELQKASGGLSDQSVRNLPSENARMAMCVLAAGPMLFIFQFFQKYFVKGLTVGSIKG